MNQEEFYDKIPEWISQKKEKWNHITLLAYFCNKYEEKNNVRFKLAGWKSDPGKSKESRDFAKLFLIFAQDNYAELKKEEKAAVRIETNRKIYNYINWMFSYKFRSGEKSVTGTGIFIIPSMINEFERMYASFVKKEHVNNKFKLLIEWCKEEIPELFDLQQLNSLNDLAMLSKYVDFYNLKDEDIEVLAISRAKNMGLL